MHAHFFTPLRAPRRPAPSRSASLDSGANIQDGECDERDVDRIVSSTVCTNRVLVRQALAEAKGDVDAAIEKVRRQRPGPRPAKRAGGCSSSHTSGNGASLCCRGVLEKTGPGPGRVRAQARQGRQGHTDIYMWDA